jgi:cytochrome c nitrite reductase small subunit
MYRLSRGMTVFMGVAGGVLAGLGLAIVRISNATSYLSDKPETCMNCHVMTDAYASWQRGSHGQVAVCNDCHVPHSNPVAKWAFKGCDGMKHSYVFTMRQEPQVLRLSSGAVPVVQSNCLRCHDNQLMMIRVSGSAERTCWDCHTNTHGKARSLAASPAELRPALPKAGWHEKSQNEKE